jgi:hypothetical protein
MWVWDTSDPGATVNLAVATGITRLYAAAPPRLGTSPDLGRLIRLTSAARAAGLRVDLLGGDPGWPDNPDGVMREWLSPALETGLFDGVHLDVEPWTRPDWPRQTATLTHRWLGLLDTIGARLGSRELEADIPFWLDQVPTNGSTLDREVMRRTTGVTVMAYRNTASGPDGSIALSAKAIRAGEDLGVPVRIGQETTYLGDSPTATKQTFFGQTRSGMEIQLAHVTDAYASSPAFAGLAIHDAAGHAAMTP